MKDLLTSLVKKTAIDSNKLVARKPDPYFIPYVCHYNPNTILTKNGELLQIIRITGFSSGSVAAQVISLRDAVRDAITDHVKDNKFAFWFNTIRRKKNISPKGEFKDFFSQQVNDAWIKENELDDQYINELYVTIITEGLDTSISNFEGFARSFSRFATKSLHHNFLEKSHTKLTQIVEKILKDTKDYGSKMLGIAEWEGVLYSEPMRLFGKIINLYEERYPLATNDMSDDLSSHNIAFGNGKLEVIGYNNKNYASVLSLKEYTEVSLEALDRVLQLPLEFIITQSFDFTYDKKDIEPYEYQNYILKISGDENFRQIGGIANFMESQKNLPTDYGKLQTTVMIINKTIDDLETDIKSATEQFNALGFVVVREDIFSEHCFWSQLPGNFSYLRRQKLINTYRIAGFASLHNFPSGSIAGNHWGPAVTVLKTILHTPYFFNFHDQNSGHSLILGPKNSGKTALTNFLLTQSRRFNNKLFYFDFNNTGKCFIEALSGQYYSLNSQEITHPKFLQLNPLLMQKNENNKNFLVSFFASLIAFIKDPIPESEIEFIPQIVDRMVENNVTTFALAAETFNAPETKRIYEKLKLWNGGKLNYIFGSATEINWSDQIIAFDLTEILSQKPILIPVVYYLLHQIEANLDGSPAIIVLNEAWKLVDNPIMAPQIKDFLEHIRQKNCIAIFTSEDTEEVGNSNLATEISQSFATKIFMPNQLESDATHNCYKNFGASDEEIEIIKVMEPDEHNFIFKHAGDSVISSFNLTHSPEILKILSADEMIISAMEEIINQSGNSDPKAWLPEIYEVIVELEKERKNLERQELHEKRMKQTKRLQGKSEIADRD